jgi:exosortase B
LNALSSSDGDRTPLSAHAAQDGRLAWLIAAAGFGAMYVPSYWTAANGLWRTDDHGHGPIVLAVAAWLFWRVAGAVATLPESPRPRAGWPLLAVGLLLYIFARVFTISSAEFASQVVVVAAMLLLLKGANALRFAWFPVFYLVFAIPLPGTLVDALTGPLKLWISTIVVEALHLVGYPVARSGVILVVGQYQLLVADACSGLNSMFSLSALGTLFMYIMARKSVVHNAVMLAAILPIAFCANIVRVIALVLVTYHWGDEAGQGFLHGAAGMVLILVALALFFLLDAVIARVSASHKRSDLTDSATRPAS